MQHPPDPPLSLDSRKQAILKAVVIDYTETGVPVGSHAVAASLAHWSSATIRNDLASLVDIGYLLQPHTSAGRLPSQRGYRYYVDFLMQEETVPVALRRGLEQQLSAPSIPLDALLEIAAQVLARVTDGVSVVTAPQALTARVKHLDLVSLDDGHALIMLVLEGNLIRQQGVPLSAPAGQRDLSTLAAQLNDALRGDDADGVAAKRTATGGALASPLREEVVDHIVRAMRAIDSRQDPVVVHDGVRNLLRQPEFGDLLHFQQVLEVVEEQRVLGALLASLEVDTGVQMIIGTESGMEQLRQCSLVLTTYRAGQSRYGTIGVLGPTRMRYSQVAPRVRYVSERVGQALDRLLG